MKYCLKVLAMFLTLFLISSCSLKSQGVQQEESYHFDTSDLQNKLKDDFLSGGETSKHIIAAATGSMLLFGEEDYYFIPASKRNPIISYYYNDKDNNLITNNNLYLNSETAHAIQQLFSQEEAFYICMRKYYDNADNVIKTVILSVSYPIEIDNMTYIYQAQLIYTDQDSEYLKELGCEKIIPKWYSRFELNNGIILQSTQGEHKTNY